MMSMLRLEDFVLIKELGLGYGGRPMCFSVVVVYLFILLLLLLLLFFNNSFFFVS